MTDKYKIDGHKLIYHPQRVASWLSGDNIYPIYIEVSPTGACNHRCIFCSKDFMGYKPIYLDNEKFFPRLKEMGNLGIKSIMFAGEGEPFLHPEISSLIVETKKNKIDVAITSNGVMMTSKISEQILEHIEWIKISCNAGTADKYEAIHRCKKDDFFKLIKNLKFAVKFRNKEQLKITLGMQLLLLSENQDTVFELAKIAEDIGLDYLVIKPYTHHTRNKHDFTPNYSKFAELDDQLKKFNTEKFKVIFRTQTMQRWDKQYRGYKYCQALPFWAYIDASAHLWGCSTHLLNDDFDYGCLYNNHFEELWNSQKRMKSLEIVKSDSKFEFCRLNCRMDKINEYLWCLTNTVDHINFI